VVATTRRVAPDGQSVRYEVHGPLFFGSSNDLIERFEYASDPCMVTIDFSKSQIWDASTVAVLDSIASRYQRHDAVVQYIGLDERSRDFHARLSGWLTKA
jgi:SulP family sulfate permease